MFLLLNSDFSNEDGPAVAVQVRRRKLLQLTLQILHNVASETLMLVELLHGFKWNSVFWHIKRL